MADGLRSLMLNSAARWGEFFGKFTGAPSKGLPVPPLLIVELKLVEDEHTGEERFEFQPPLEARPSERTNKRTNGRTKEHAHAPRGGLVLRRARAFYTSFCLF